MHVKRLTLIGVAAIAAGYTFLSNAGPAIEVPRSPVAAASATPAPACSQAPAHEDYRRVCQADLARFDLGAALKPMPLALAGLDFEPLDVAGTPLASFTSLGGTSEAVGQLHSRLYRSFRMPDGRTLTLFEHDLAADAPGSAPALQDEVGQRRLKVLQDDGGKAMSVLSWRAGTREYQLWIDADVTRDDARQRLLALAAALPGAVR